MLGLGTLAGGAALAQGQSSQDAYELQEPHVSSSQVLRMSSDSSCVHSTRAKVRFLPPPGAVFGVLRITADGAEAVRMTGVPRAASATIRLSGASTVVRVCGTTIGGQQLHRARTYRRCGSTKPKAKPKRRQAPKKPPAIQVGGGEDG